MSWRREGVLKGGDRGIKHAPSITDESWISRIAEASTMFRTMKRLMALSFGTSTPDASQRTRLTCAGVRKPSPQVGDGTGGLFAAQRSS